MNQATILQLMRTVLGLTFMLYCMELPAQSDYLAIIAHGRAYVYTETGFHQLESGEHLADSSRIELVEDAWVSFIDESGRFFNFGGSGKFLLKRRDSILKGDSSMFAAKVWKDYYQELGTLKEVNPSSIPLEMHLPSSSEVFGFSQVVPWWSKGSGPFEVEFLNEYEEIIHKATTEQFHLEIDFLSKELAWRRQVFLKVRDLDSGSQSGLYALKKVAPPEYDDLEKEIQKLPQGDSRIAVLTKAALFEQRNLYTDFHTLLLESSKSDPVIKKFYENFLSRNGFRY